MDPDRAGPSGAGKMPPPGIMAPGTTALSNKNNCGSRKQKGAMRMNTTQVDCFLEAAKYRSFSTAASRLFVSQSTLSRNISLLEQELGITLFYRNSFHGIELTEAGRIMMETFTETRKQLRQALEKAQRAESSRQIHMSLGLLDGQLLDDRLNDVISDFKQEYPNVKVHIRRGSYQTLIAGLESGDISVVCMPAWQFPKREDIRQLSICQIETILVVPKRLMDPVEDRVYSIREFASLPFVSTDESESKHNTEMLLDLFRSCQMSPKIIRCSTMQEQIQTVEMGEGVILINPYNAICYSPTVHCLKVAELEPQPFAAAWKANSDSEAVRHFHDFAERYADTQG